LRQGNNAIAITIASPTTRSGNHKMDIPSLETAGARRHDRSDDKKAPSEN
jgi:hypothetical protein